MKVINDSNSKVFVKYILETREELILNDVDTKELDFEVVLKNDTSKKYGIIVSYRNIPESESRSSVFKTERLNNHKKVCKEKGLIPTLAFLVFDGEKKATYVLLFTIERLEELSKDKDAQTFNEVVHGLQLKYGVGHRTLDELLHSLKMKVDCTEVQYSDMNFFD